MTLSKRVTVWHGQYKADAYERANIESNLHPTSDAIVTGSPGHWRVRRERRSCDPPEPTVIRHCQHPDCKVERFL